MANETPMMIQFRKIKSGLKDTILFFRCGDFYEMFHEDAVDASKILNITLTSRNKNAVNSVPMCGIPYHAMEGYVSKLIRAGRKVAIIEQTEDKKGGKLVDREVVKVITPGTVGSNILDIQGNNYLAALVVEPREAGIAMVDLNTAEFFYFTLPSSRIPELSGEFYKFQPAECLIPESLSLQEDVLQRIRRRDMVVTTLPDWQFDPSLALNKIKDHFKIQSLKGFGVDEKTTCAVRAAGAVLHYLEETQKTDLCHITTLRFLNTNAYMLLDEITQKNLELTVNMQTHSAENTLRQAIDRTRTSMGARMLKRFILRPLVRRSEIEARQDCVTEFYEDPELGDTIQNLLKTASDLEKLLSRVAMGTAGPRDLRGLADTIELWNTIHEVLKEKPTASSMIGANQAAIALASYINARLVENPPALLTDGSFIRDGISQELDETRAIRVNAKSVILKYESEEREQTGIKSLKIAYNKIFGYYIEVTKTHAKKAPSEYLKKQTLVNAERFTTEKLQELEVKILNSQDRIKELENEIFSMMRTEILQHTEELHQLADALAYIDVMTNFAHIAREKKYTRPLITDNETVRIIEGRHPVIEDFLTDEQFIPNDVCLDTAENMILIITGPNMSGKSTYLRQTAIIVLLAHIGCYVPAREATIGLVDRIFTRVGASDNLARGESTFLVEMNETANILNNATAKSLIIMDEIGRGTSTYDGLSIAWAVLEYLHNKSVLGAKTLFATHYHELAELEEKKGIRLKNVEVKEWNNQVIFMRRIIDGAADKSYGIYVAALAGLPKTVIERAKKILSALESGGNWEYKFLKSGSLDQTPDHSVLPGKAAEQLSLFGGLNPNESSVLTELRGLDVNQITPIQALEFLIQYQQKLNQS